MGEEMGQDGAVTLGLDEYSRLGEVLHAGGRAAIGAMAMTGMRVLTTELGLVNRLRRRPSVASARGLRALLRRAPRKQRRGLIEVAPWAFGAVGGAGFGALPRTARRRRWAGPVYGLGVCLGFEMGLAPALGLSQAKRVRPVDRLALAADHLLYRLVLSEMRRHAQRLTERPAPRLSTRPQGWVVRRPRARTSSARSGTGA